MNPHIVEKSAFTAVGYRIETEPKSEVIAQLWADKGENLGQVPHAVGDGVYGVMKMKDSGAMLEYMAAVAVSKVDELPEGMCRWDVPATTYAIFEATLPTLSTTFDSVYGEWLPSSEYQRADAPDLENYGPGFNPHDPNSKLSVCVPVTKG